MPPRDDYIGDVLKPYIGVPFEEANCYELLRRIFLGLYGVTLPPQPYEGATMRHGRANAALMAEESKKWIQVPAGDERFGDVVLPHIHGLPCHIGFAVGGGRMLHAQENTHSVIVSYRRALEWRDRHKSFYRHPAIG